MYKLFTWAADTKPRQTKPNVVQKDQINSVIITAPITNDMHPMLAPINKICSLTVRQGIGRHSYRLVGQI